MGHSSEWLPGETVLSVVSFAVRKKGIWQLFFAACAQEMEITFDAAPGTLKDTGISLQIHFLGIMFNLEIMHLVLDVT